MADEKYTRCPGCTTVFRVTPQQLAHARRPGPLRPLQDGVRRRARTDLARAASAPAGRRRAAYNEAAQGPPTVTLRNAQALHPVRPRCRAGRGASDAEPEEDISEIAYEERFAWTRPSKPRRAYGALMGIAIPLLVIALIAQAALPLPRCRRGAVAGIEARAHPRVRRCRMRDQAVARPRDAIPVDRRLRPAGRSGAPGTADPRCERAQPCELAARVSRISSSR